MDRDPLSIDEIEFSLWLHLVCQCDRCNKLLELSEFEHLVDTPIEWAKAAAPIVQAQEWEAPQEGTLLCQGCASKNA